MHTHAHSTKEWKREQTKKIRRKSIGRNRFSNNLGVKIGVFAITLKWIFLHLNTCYWLEQTFEIIHTETCTGLIISMRNAFFEIVNVCYVFFFIVNHTILYFFFLFFSILHTQNILKLIQTLQIDWISQRVWKQWTTETVILPTKGAFSKTFLLFAIGFYAFVCCVIRVSFCMLRAYNLISLNKIEMKIVREYFEPVKAISVK